MVNHITMRIIDQFDIHLDVMNRWDGVLSHEKQGRNEEG
jgi:3-polyprenyl-4-hydroxybenzoate decarboxylase